MSENKVGIIGYPVKHSLSPVMHNAAFKHLGMDNWLYDAMEIPPDIARHAIVEPKRHGYVGLNVTAPFKQTVMEFVRPDDKARAIGAVNTIDFRDDSGTNTDADGFINDLIAHDVPLSDETVLILGAGGAARAAVYGLWQQGANVIVVNRTKSRADDMLMDLTFSAGIQTARSMTLDEAVEQSPSLIVNCTSVGMQPEVDSSPWIAGVPFPEGITVYDMVYRPTETALMKQCKAHDGRAIGGLGMLVRQGAAAFKIWTGVDAPIDIMMQAAKSVLQQHS
ncbi:MAG: shikimate dehydrogenase [Aggregatilineales bacterium]